MRDPTAPELNHTHTHIFIHTSLGTASHSHTLCGLTPPMPHSFLWLRVNTMPVAPDATLLRTKARVALALGLAPVCRRNSSSRPVLCLKALSLFIFSAPSATASPALPPWPQTPPPPQPPSPAPHSPPSPPPDIQLSQTPIYQDVATTLNISGQGTAVGDTVVLLSAAGPPGCAGAQALTSTSQSSVISAQHTIEITLPHSLISHIQDVHLVCGTSDIRRRLWVRHDWCGGAHGHQCSFPTSQSAASTSQSSAWASDLARSSAEGRVHVVLLQWPCVSAGHHHSVRIRALARWPCSFALPSCNNC